FSVYYKVSLNGRRLRDFTLPPASHSLSGQHLCRPHPRQHAPHVGERLDHAGKRVAPVDLVFQVDVALEVNFDELIEDVPYRHLASSHVALAFFDHQVGEVLDVDVEHARAGQRDLLDDVLPRPGRVADVHAQPDTRVHV